MSQNVVNLKIAGLHTNHNYLQEVPPGSFSRCDDYNIDRKGVLEKRRGYNVYGSPDDLMDVPASQLLQYRGRVLRHYGNKIDIDRGNATFHQYSGSYLAPNVQQRIRSIEFNDNLYFTSDTGIKKISAKNNNQLTEVNISEAGAVEALSIETEIIAGPSWLSPLSKSIYRIVWGYYDNNQNLILGAPSDFSIVTNSDDTDSKAVRISTRIPQEAIDNKNYFYRIYRGAVFSVTNPADLDLVVPQDELNLVIEDFPSTTDYTNGFIQIDDTVPDSFREGGTLLYTNAVSGEGIAGANLQPPMANDICEYKNFVFYANTKTRHTIQFSVISVDDFADDGTDKFVIYSDGVMEEYPYKDPADESLGEVQLSDSPSVGIAVEETAKSLVRAINNVSNLVTAFYTSGVNDFPGNITLKAKIISQDPVYIAVDGVLGDEYIPTLPRLRDSINYTAGATTTIDTPPDNLTVGDVIIVYDSGALDGQYFVQTIGATDFTINLETSSNGTLNFFRGSSVSNNAEFQNRIYYSKLQEPEAVPGLNFFDVGTRDTAILRIFGLRDSIFVLKEDSIYRISGETPQSFVVSLFDASTEIISADSAAILNNQIFALTRLGVASISDTGVSIVSKEIENLINRSTLNENFERLSFAITNENDRVYILFTTTNTSSVVADQAFRYNVDTRTWTRWRLSKTCGLNNIINNRVYLGAADINHIEIQRKDRERTDYCDRQFNTTLQPNGINGTTISGFININTINFEDSGTYNIDVGDAIKQKQYLTLSQFNGLLRKLDVDMLLKRSDISIIIGTNTNIIFSTPHNLNTNDTIIISDVVGVNSEVINQEFQVTVISPTQIQIPLNSSIYSFSGGTVRYSYEKNLLAKAGDNLALKLNSLLNKLQIFLDDKYFEETASAHVDSNGNDAFNTTAEYVPAQILAAQEDFLNTISSEDDQIIFNLLIDRLNAHPKVFLTNYTKISGFKEFEEIVKTVNRNQNRLTVSTLPSFVFGVVTVFKAIESVAVWNPNAAGDPALMKQASEGTILFESQNFTRGTVEYTTDLSTGFSGIEFEAEGLSNFGQYPFGSQGFGGVATARPARVTIPRDKTRFRFISPRITHKVALENIAIYGMSLYVRSVSQRAYRGFRGF